MSPIEFWCDCGRRLRVRPDYVGRRTDCPDCGASLVVPDRDWAARAREWRPGDDAGTPATSVPAVASLALGLLSFCLSIFSGLPAIVLGIVALRQIGRSRGRLQGTTLAALGIGFGSLGILFTCVVVGGLILSLARDRQQAATCRDHLGQVGRALAEYDRRRGHLPPPAIVDPWGRPLLSWRVELLRVSDPALYARFHLDESWDSPHNPPSPDGRRTSTPARRAPPAGPGRLLDALSRPGRPLAGPIRGASEEGRAASPRRVRRRPGEHDRRRRVGRGRPLDEAGRPLLFARPLVPAPRGDQRDFSKEGPAPRFGHAHSGLFHALLGDGTVRSFHPQFAAASLRRMFTRNAKERLGR